MSGKETGLLSYLTGADVIKEHLKQEKDVLKKATGRDDALPLEAGLKTAAQIYWQRLDLMAKYPAVLAVRLSGLPAMWDFAEALVDEVKDPFTGEAIQPFDEELEKVALIGFSLSRQFAAYSVILGATAGTSLLRQEYFSASIGALASLATAFTSGLFNYQAQESRQLLLRKWNWRDISDKDNSKFDYSPPVLLTKTRYPNLFVRQMIYGTRELDSLPPHKTTKVDKQINEIKQLFFMKEHEGQEILCEALGHNECKKDDCPFFIPTGTLNFQGLELPACKEHKFVFAKQTSD
ncbi:MAG: hypothetical protein WCV81_03470 [Microgenomates group bacterium]|jgi:hypothetical protein